MRHIRHSFTNPTKIARHYAKMAVRALYDEVALYPKPGLVSFVDSGAHQDMDGNLFFLSLFGLRHYFFQVGLYSALGHPPAKLVAFGQRAETTMHEITQGVNTHRGAIFALGIMCTTICQLSHKYQSFSSQDLHLAIIEQWGEYLEKQHNNLHTHGSFIKKKYAVPDAKQMAIEGYKLVFETYYTLLDVQNDPEFFGLLAYQRFLLAIDDINILYRTGPEGLKFARHAIEKNICSTNREKSIEEAIKLHSIFSRSNISPGGVADMLALLFFLRHVFTGKHSSDYNS